MPHSLPSISALSSRFRIISCFTVLCLFVLTNQAVGQDHTHDHGQGHAAQDEPPVERPRVFLDKSPRVVKYQLDRLENPRLLLVERKTDDAKYVPVFSAILTRSGMTRQHRQEALAGLLALNHSTAAAELINAIESLDPDEEKDRATARQLANMLMQASPGDLENALELLEKAARSESRLTRRAAFAGLLTGRQSEIAMRLAQVNSDLHLSWLESISWLDSEQTRADQREAVVASLDASFPMKVRRAAIQALAVVPDENDTLFPMVATFVSDSQLRPAAVRTLLAIDESSRDNAAAGAIVKTLVNLAEETPASERTTDEFVDAMQLTDQLMPRVPADLRSEYRDRLRQVTVRVVRIRTVEEEMRYDTPYFAVEAGRPVQIVLTNDDLMPHNLVVTLPEQLQPVALEGAALGPNPGFEGKAYVPDSPDVLFATNMVASREQERLTFTAPTEPGEYPYVCTFPGHWMRMYGVMVVVDDLDAWLQDPVPPADPIGNNRPFVRAWKLDDFQEDLEQAVRGRTLAIGEKIFHDATCAQCHQANGVGGKIGPDLDGVFDRYEKDRLTLLREVIDPSHNIDAKYTVSLVVTLDGLVYTGIITEQNNESISIVFDPAADEPTMILQDDIDEIVTTDKSIMPNALLDHFTRDEVYELLSYLESLQAAAQD